MGRARRWFKSLFGSTKKEIIEQREKNSNIGYDQNQIEKKKRWSFTKGRRDSGDTSRISGTIPVVNLQDDEANWLRSFYSENEQSKKAIAVAAATAAVADAAIVAAQAAVAVVRLTSNHGRRTTIFNGDFRERRLAAVIKIQTVFRGFLAKKALRALKGLVKIQALFRGYLVRKQTTATLHSMEALIRAQATIRSQRSKFSRKDHLLQPEFRSRKSIERLDEPRSGYTSSTRSWRLSSSIETSMNNFNESPKIVEIDTYKPKSRSQRTSSSMRENCESPSLYKTPSHLSIRNCRNYSEFDWSFMGNEYKFSTAQNTPRFVNFDSSNLLSKSVCADSLYSNSPNYMANTQSYKAKVRSCSAPKQRPEESTLIHGRKKILLNEFVESRASLSCIKMRKSFSQSQEHLDSKKSVMGEIADGSCEMVCEAERDYLHTRW